MKLSTRTRYGLRMLIALAKKFNQGPYQISEISRLEEISEKYLGQISIILRNNGIIESTRGSQGGFYLTKDPALLNLKDIVEILEGDISLVSCSDINGECNRTSQCVTKDIWEEVNNAIKSTLSKYTLQDIVDLSNTKDGEMFYI
ncbi:MAG: hypothetical protein A2015_15100 [Spirochaetes bacterium GWF1_31_7]|nr:MAG: hypothetical protein A2Y30_11525 [Spirochaetes bacterium GWE1_32_154]OHD51150.1 MAG: hypothetical protein A2Y29_01065 [Spirochaetes bacterium GWE2_31_10]OHD52069.1 MAG: hypothetical protein A2015_15100 [Spirochaetes bacterium GWF1_31_7]OHD80855.1 MAG: hypothetical protein A2355_15015 [Spirochaetes bacterium RIFOXYB1_FULL_32_8]